MENNIINLTNKLQNKRPLLVLISQAMYAAVMQNFQSETAGLNGPKWQPLSPATIKARKKKGHWPGRILQVSGGRAGLKGSIQAHVDESSATVGTNLNYAAIHQYGGIINRAARSETFIRPRVNKGTKKGQFAKSKKRILYGQGFSFKAHSIRIPARPFLILSDNNISAIKAEIITYLTTV